MTEPAGGEELPRSSLRAKQVDLTRDLIMSAFTELIQRDDPEAVTFARVAAEAGVSVRTVYRYFPTRVALLETAAAWLRELAPVRWDDPKTVTDLRGAFPEMGRVFDEHTNVFRAVSEAVEELPQPRRDAAAAAAAEVSERLPEDEVRRAAAMLGVVRSGKAWLVLHDEHGLDGDEILSALDWAGSALVDDLKRRNAQVAAKPNPRPRKR